MDFKMSWTEREEKLLFFQDGIGKTLAESCAHQVSCTEDLTFQTGASSVFLVSSSSAPAKILHSIHACAIMNMKQPVASLWKWNNPSCAGKTLT